jgi:hypothetical protein
MREVIAQIDEVMFFAKQLALQCRDVLRLSQASSFAFLSLHLHGLLHGALSLHANLLHAASESLFSLFQPVPFRNRLRAIAHDRPAAPNAALVAVGGRGPNVLPHTVDWEDLCCEVCGKVAGRYKFHESPGFRDAPTWYWKCYDYRQDCWPKTQKTRLASLMPDHSSEIKQWVHENRSCCQG